MYQDCISRLAKLKDISLEVKVRIATHIMKPQID